MQGLDKSLAHKADSNMPEWPSYGNFRQVTQTRKENFSKIFQKVDLVWKAQKHTFANGIIL